jgi:hypothetical protein
MALAGALGLAACSGGDAPVTDSSPAKGVFGQNFYVNLFATPVGGTIVSSDNRINCGAQSVTVVGDAYNYTYYGSGANLSNKCGQFLYQWTDVVTLTATAQGGNAFGGWAGDCVTTYTNGVPNTTCTLDTATAGTDKTVVAVFGAANAVGHGAFASSAVHGPAALAFATDVAGAFQCTACHGDNLQGAGTAPSCASCHAALPHFKFTNFNAGFTTGPAVSRACVKCHAERASQMLTSNHFTWMGSSTSVGQTTSSSIGKRNVINNFCVANASNESRCMQCHPSYSVAPVKNAATGAFAVNTGPMYLWNTDPAVDKSRIDCLICHANLGTSKYLKGPAGFGQPWIANSGACFPSCSAAQVCATTDSAGAAWTDGQPHCRAPVQATEIQPALKAAADSLGGAQRSNCGFCHFNAGGGDNVKMGDLGSALKAPTQAVDVHMGSAQSYAPKLCADCHQSGSHTVRGSGLSIPIDNEGRFTCTDCHSGIYAPAHTSAMNTTHADWLACQTCHIPAFSRTQFTKVFWDWQTAGDKQACQGQAGCVGFGSLSYPAGNAQTGTIAGVGGESTDNPVADLVAVSADLGITMAEAVTKNDWKKGVSTYAKGVNPTYRWIAPAGQQQGTHETTALNGLLGLGTKADPYRLADLLPPPAPVLAGWKIAPFKKMSGRSPAFANGSAMVVPHVFGNDSLWQNDLRGYPVVPNNLGSAANPWTQAKADAIWTGANNYGAALGKQLAAVASAAGNSMTRDATNLVTVNTVADLPATLPATLYLVGAEAAFPTGVKTVTKTGARQFTYTETIPYTTNPSASPAIVLPALPANSTQFVTFYPELKATDWAWAYTVMYINLNHEVAPKATALTCANCHPSMGGTIDGSRMKELYNLQVGGCEDPMLCKKR